MELFFLFLIGLCVGSFCNVLADRLPHGEDVLVSRSHCDFCKKPLSWYELIPLVSFIIQQRKCRHCHKLLSLQYPLIELITAIGFVCIGLNSWLLIIFAMSIVILVADFKYFIIPDEALIVGGLASIAYISTLPFSELLMHGKSAVVAFGIFYLLYWGTKRKGMGFGDVKLAGVMGLLLGYPDIIIAMYTAFLTGAIAGVILMMVGKAKMKTRVPFGPFLIIGGFVAFCYGTTLWQWWFSLL